MVGILAPDEYLERTRTAVQSSNPVVAMIQGIVRSLLITPTLVFPALVTIPDKVIAPVITPVPDPIDLIYLKEDEEEEEFDRPNDCNPPRNLGVNLPRNLNAKQKKKLNKWKRRCISLMKEFKVPHKFVWCPDRTTYGWCSDKQNKIALSWFFTLYCDDDSEIEETIRHEIGHALAGCDAGHGRKWKQMGSVAAYKPEQYSTYDIPHKHKNFVYTCGRGHVSLSSFKRLKYPPNRCHECGSSVRPIPVKEARKKKIV